MRDLTTETHRATNGDGPPILDMDPPEISDEASLRQARAQHRVVKRDKALAEIAVLLIDSARMLEPIVTLLSGRALRWASLIAAMVLASQAMRDPSWERLAVLAGFMILSPLIWWRA
jgi:hypothetical protein